MVSPLSYSSNPADGGIIYLDGLTAEKDQRIQIVSFNDLLISPDDIENLEKRPFISEEEIEKINSKNLSEAEKKKLLDELKKKTTEEKKAQKREAKKIAYDIAEQFNRRAAMNGRCKNRFMGVVLSFPDSERDRLEKDPQLMEDIVQDWLAGMKFEDAQHFAVYHYGTAQPHIHVYVNMVGPDLKVYNSFQTKYRSQQVNREIEKKYGLKPGIGIDNHLKVDLEKTNPKNKVRMEIFNLVKGCLDTYIPSLKILKDFLFRNGVEMKVIENTNGTKGLVFSKDNISFRGGDVGRMFTYGNLTKRICENKIRYEIFCHLSEFVGLKKKDFRRVPAKELPNQEGLAQHRRRYYQRGPEAFAIDKNGDRYAIINAGKEFFISESPYLSDAQIQTVNWIGIDGRKISFQDLYKTTFSKTPKNRISGTSPAVIRGSIILKDESPKHTTATVTGQTVRDNKIVHSSDLLDDDTEEVVDENGNVRKVRKHPIKM